MSAPYTPSAVNEFVGYSVESSGPNEKPAWRHLTATCSDAIQERFESWLAQHDADPSNLPFKVVELIYLLTDDEDCWFDHHGGCQAHGFLEPGPGEVCPHAEAKQLLVDAKEARP